MTAVSSGESNSDLVPKCIKVIYSSRTHTQLEQFAAEVKRTGYVSIGYFLKLGLVLSAVWTVRRRSKTYRVFFSWFCFQSWVLSCLLFEHWSRSRLPTLVIFARFSFAAEFFGNCDVSSTETYLLLLSVLSGLLYIMAVINFLNHFSIYFQFSTTHGHFRIKESTLCESECSFAQFWTR